MQHKFIVSVSLLAMRLKDVTINATRHELPPLRVHFGVSYGHKKCYYFKNIFFFLIEIIVNTVLY